SHALGRLGENAVDLSPRAGHALGPRHERNALCIDLEILEARKGLGLPGPAETARLIVQKRPGKRADGEPRTVHLEDGSRCHFDVFHTVSHVSTSSNSKPHATIPSAHFLENHNI